MEEAERQLEAARKEAEEDKAAREQGTPKGEGAKRLVPMVLARLREAQEELEHKVEELRAAEERERALDDRVDELRLRLKAANGEWCSPTREA